MGNDSIQNLRTAIEKGHILAIVGAGVSIASTNDSRASWTGLLRHGIERTIALNPHLKNAWEKRCRRELESGNLGKLISVAGKISKELGAPRGGEFRKWLRESVGELGEPEVPNPSVLQALASLNVQLATTNYDGLIEKVTGLRSVTWQNKNLVDRLVRKDESAVLHLHGYWEEPESIALSKKSYEGLRRNRCAQHTMRVLCSSRTFLYVGCGTGLADPNFSSFLTWQQELFSECEHQHFLLSINREAEEFRRQHPLLLERILVIPYGDEYEDLPRFLQSLVPSRGSTITEKATTHADFRQPSRCYGRKGLVQSLVRTVCSDLPVSIAVLGPPGIGKTTITQKAGSDPRVCERFGARRYFVLCESAISREALLSKIALTLKLRPDPALEVEAMIFQELECSPTLLVLDNLETPRDNDEDSVDQLIAKLAAVPDLALVVSLRGMQRPFGPSWNNSIKVGPLSIDDARKSFLAVAGNNFRNDPQLDSLLERFDRIPLPITLLAREAEGGLDLSSLSRRLQEEPKLLQRAGGGKRLNDLAFSLGLSISSPRMSDEARRLLTLLGYLPSGVAQEDLSGLLPEGSEAAAATLRQVGLVVSDDPRLRAYVREYVRLWHPPTQDDLTRAIHHYIRLIHSGEAAKRENRSDYFDRLAPEDGNFQAMVLEALKSSDAVPGIEAALALAEFSFAADSCQGVLPEALKIARTLEDEGRQARLLKKLGDTALDSSDHPTAQGYYDAALPLFQKGNNLAGQADCIRKLGDIAFRTSQHDIAHSHYEQALPLFQSIDDSIGMAYCLQGFGEIALDRSDIQMASDHFERARALFKVRSDLGLANSIRGLGGIALERPDLATAQSLFEEALVIYRRIHEIIGQANCTADLGEIARRETDYALASKLFEEARSLYRSVSSIRGETNCVRKLGEVAFHQKDYDTARRYLKEALEAYSRIGSGLGRPHCLMYLGDLELAQSNRPEAKRLYEEALVLYEQIPNPQYSDKVRERLSQLSR